jgi:hypothetical protein
MRSTHLSTAPHPGVRRLRGPRRLTVAGIPIGRMLRAHRIAPGVLLAAASRQHVADPWLSGQIGREVDDWQSLIRVTAGTGGTSRRHGSGWIQRPPESSDWQSPPSRNTGPHRHVQRSASESGSRRRRALECASSGGDGHSLGRPDHVNARRGVRHPIVSRVDPRAGCRAPRPRPCARRLDGAPRLACAVASRHQRPARLNIGLARLA